MLVTVTRFTYIDENNNPVNEDFTGTTWSKKITTNQSDDFKYAQFGMSMSPLLPHNNINGDAVILVNGKNVKEQVVQLGKLHGNTLNFTLGYHL